MNRMKTSGAPFVQYRRSGGAWLVVGAWALSGCSAGGADGSGPGGQDASRAFDSALSPDSSRDTPDAASTHPTPPDAGSPAADSGALRDSSLPTPDGGARDASLPDAIATADASAPRDSGPLADAPSGSDAPSGAVASLRVAAEQAGKYIATALTPTHFSEAAYMTTAAREFDGVTPENEMKWSATEPNQGQFSFGGGDSVVTFAQQNGMKVKGHTLVWHSQLPAWVTALTGADAVRAAMTNHITTVATHYKGKVFAWDVVNEAIDDANGNAIRNDVFNQNLGTGYIAEAFTIAHQADPDALLFYNDFGTEGIGGKADAAYNLVKGLVAQGVPISGIGLQMHVQGTGSPSAADIATNMHRLAALGLMVNVSEMDVDVCGVSGAQTAKFAAESTRMHDIVAACMSEPRCIGVTLWGVTDKFSWLNSFSPCATGQTGSPWGLVFDDGYQRKPAWKGIVDAFGRR
jgi:endo-1,4-beta-xylanase